MFSRAERYDLAFMYFAGGHDGEGCTRGQKELAQRWAKENGVATTKLDTLHPSGVYHGAMHLYNLTFWLRPEVQVR